MASKSMKAVVTGDLSLISRGLNAVRGKGIAHGASVGSTAVPTISPNQLLVKVHAVALNPTDQAHIEFLSGPNRIGGCDYAGHVEAIGDAVTTWSVGDRVAGAVHGGYYTDEGSFAEYLKTDEELAWHIPDGVSDTDAASYSTSALTAMLTLYITLDVPWPDDTTADKKDAGTIFIYGGSTTAGLATIQLAKLAGMTVVTTCSPKNFELVKQYGADSVYDYHSKDVVDEIVAAHPGIKKSLDCISQKPTIKMCCDVLAGSGGTVVALLPFGTKSTRSNVVVTPILAYTLMGKPFQWFPPIGPKWPAYPERKEAAARFAKLMPSLLEHFKPPPIKLLEGGFDGILPGLQDLKNGKVSGQKLVVELV